MLDAESHVSPAVKENIYKHAKIKLCRSCDGKAEDCAYFTKNVVDVFLLDHSIAHSVSSTNDIVPADLCQRNSSLPTRFKAYSSACWDVEPHSICASSIKLQRSVGFDEVVMTSNLYRSKNRPQKQAFIPTTSSPNDTIRLFFLIGRSEIFSKLFRR